MVDARLFQALSDPTRLKILLLLSRSTMNVTNIVNEVKAAQPAVSRHLRVLREASLINHERKGKEVEYSLNQPQLRDAKLYIEALAGGPGGGPGGSPGGGPEIVEVAVSGPEAPPLAEPVGAVAAAARSSSEGGRGRERGHKSSGPGILGRRAGKAGKPGRVRKKSAGRTSDSPEATGRASRDEMGKPEPATYSERFVVKREVEEAMDDFLL